MSEEISPALGISRRDLLRRGAVVGGALVWSTPMIHSVALAQTQGTPVPEEPGAISYVAMVLTCDGQDHQVKFEVTGDTTGEWVEPGDTPGCNPPQGWCGPGGTAKHGQHPLSSSPGSPDQPQGSPGGPQPGGTPANDCPQNSDGGLLGITVSGDTELLCFLLPANCVFVDGVAMGAGGDLSPNNADGFCSPPQVNGQTVCFQSLK